MVEPSLVVSPEGDKFGGAIELDGDGDCADMGSMEDFDLSGGLTVSSWMKVGKFDKQFQALVTKGDSAWRLHRMDVHDVMSFNVLSRRE